MKKLLITIGCALVAQIIPTFAQQWGMTQEELGRENLRDRQMDAIYNEAGRSRHESLSYPTYQRR